MAFCIQNYDLRNIFQTERKHLLLTGMYPLRSEKPYRRLLHTFSKCVYYFYAYSFFFSMAIELGLGMDDLSGFAESLSIFITHFTLLCKMANFEYRHKKILETEDRLVEPQFYGFSDRHLAAFKAKVKSCMRICHVYRGLCVLGVVALMQVPFLDEIRHNTLPVPGWYPGNYTDYYPLALAHQYGCLIFTVFTHVNMDVLAWVMISMAAAQFDVLKQNLMDICYRREKGRVEDDEKLRKCVELHLAILSYAKNIQEIFSYGIFIQFLASVIIICFMLFQLIFEPFGSFRFTSLVGYMNCMLCQVAMYCWFGHGLTVTSEAVGRDFYMSNWYESDVRLRKNMMIFLENVKRPVVLTAGNIIPLSLATLITILRSSYSYLAVLQRFYSEK